jgi:hypothetical protein
MSSKPYCDDTVLAIIYTGLQESNEPLAQDIEHLETHIWEYCGERYLGIFLGSVAPEFTKFGRFHCSTETCHVNKSGLLDPALLLDNGTTHVLIVGTAINAVALEAVQYGFQTCVFQKRAEGPPVEELTAAGVKVADTEPALNGFLDAVMARRAGVHPHRPECYCEAMMDRVGAPPSWCAYKRNNFLWQTNMRLRRAVSAVTAKGFDGSQWLCSEAEKDELGAAIDQAKGAGIYVGDTPINILVSTPSFERVNWFTFWSIKDAHAAAIAEVIRLKAELASLTTA